MKSVLGAFLFCSILATSCNKQAVSPKAENEITNSLFFKDVNIEVVNMKAIQNNTASVTVSFSTLYETNIQKLEIMSGNTPNTLCSIYVTSVGANSNKSKGYSFEDLHLKGKTMYYMIRYTTVNGDWGFTPLYTMEIN